jgi:hypothetical protein
MIKSFIRHVAVVILAILLAFIIGEGPGWLKELGIWIT